MIPRLSAFLFGRSPSWLEHGRLIPMYYNYLPTKIGSGYGLTMAGFSCHCARRISEEICCDRDLGGLANLACTLSQLYEPRPLAFPHFCLPRTYVAAKATTASHNSYKVRPVGSPLYLLSPCMSERILLQESKGGRAKELQRTSGLYDAMIRFSLLSSPVAL